MNSPYVRNILAAIQGRRPEGFKEEDAPIQVGATIIAPILLSIVLIFASMYGASHLSWCYNKSIGASDGTAMMWALLCFFFSGFYYPFYAIFLHQCTVTRVLTGGRRRW